MGPRAWDDRDDGRDRRHGPLPKRAMQAEAADGEDDAIRVEVNAYVKDKDFEGDRMMREDGERRPERRGDRPERRDDGRRDDPWRFPGGRDGRPERRGRDERREGRPERPERRPHRPEDRDMKEAGDGEDDAIVVEVKAYVKDKDMEGKRMKREDGERRPERHGDRPERRDDGRRPERRPEDPWRFPGGPERRPEDPWRF